MNVHSDAELYVLLRKAGEPRDEAQALIDRNHAEVLHKAADALEARVADVDVDTRTTWAGMDAAYLRHLADSGQPATPVTARDLHTVLLDAVESFQASVNSSRAGLRYNQQLANHLLTAIAPLVPYREVWSGDLPPGGRVCGTCGQPVESEPCPDHSGGAS